MNVALVLSGGTGSRIGGSVPKQYMRFGGLMMATRCMRTIFSHELIGAVQVVADPAWHGAIASEAGENIPAFAGKFRGFSEPGATRQLSILSGLLDISRYAGPDDVVMIHDAARPLLTAGAISSYFAGLGGHDGLMPALPMKDTVYMGDGSRVTGLLPRAEVFAGQAPELFRLGKYLAANRALSEERMLTINGASEPALLAGLDVVMAPGDEGNFKITTPADIARYHEILERGGEAVALRSS